MFTRFICGKGLARLGLAFTFASLGLTELQAAPVTLRFNATVGPAPSGAGPTSLPFSFVEGDPVRGTLTYESLDVAPSVALTETLQPFALTFEIGGHSFGVSSYVLVSVNDTPILTEPPRTSGDIDPPPSDALVLTTSLAGEDVTGPRYVDGPGSAEFDFFLRIVGDDNILEGADFPSVPTAWNDFDQERALWLTFRDLSTNMFSELKATVTSFAIVPEPCSAVLCFSSLAVLYSLLPRNRARDRESQ